MATAKSRCRHCGAQIVWTLEDLLYHRERLEAGEHAVNACDDDCAAEVAPWTRAELTRVIHRAERGIGSGPTDLQAVRDDGEID